MKGGRKGRNKKTKKKEKSEGKKEGRTRTGLRKKMKYLPFTHFQVSRIHVLIIEFNEFKSTKIRV